SPLGHLARQAGEGAGPGHEKVHETLAAAEKGKGFLGKGREILEQGLLIVEGQHAKKTEEVLSSGGEVMKGVLGGGKADAEGGEGARGNGRGRRGGEVRRRSRTRSNG